ncbi:MAG: glycosyltransferase [bacterium]|nr:glycosyltransferase [bacterium]
MKILFLLPQIPYPPHSGGRIVTWNTIKRFALECETHVACLYHHPDELKYLEEVQKVCASAEAFAAGKKWDINAIIRSFLSTWPYKAHRFYNHQMAKYVQRKLREEAFDAVHAQNFYTTSYIHGDEPCLKIHYKENVEGNILLRYARASRNPLVKAAAWLEGHRTRRFEKTACEKFDRILTISPDDRDALLKLSPHLDIEHQRPGVDLETYPCVDEEAGPPTVVFTGTMSYYPNADGVRVFLRDEWPRVRARMSDAECWIVGAGPPDDIAARDGRNGVHVTGRVDDISVYLKRAHVYIVPLRVGGGIRLKILEAMASGRAVVSTAVGSEGLDLRDGEHLRTAELHGGFADAVADLLKNESDRRRLREAARARIEDRYDWDVVIREQMRRYQSLIQSRTQPTAP